MAGHGWRVHASGLDEARYVLYFLPPMGDGTVLSSDRPYVVACEYELGLNLVTGGFRT